jgi:hypothetical protein
MIPRKPYRWFHFLRDCVTMFLVYAVFAFAASRCVELSP